MEKLSAASVKGDRSSLLLDARPPEEFNGARLSEDVPRAGHIPGAKGL